MLRCYEHASTVLMSNKSFSKWGEIFGDEVTATALIDRLVYYCYVVNIRGNGYWLKNHVELYNACHSSTSAGSKRPSRREADAS